MDTAKFVENIKKYCALKGVKPTVACRESGVGTSFINNIEVRGTIPSVEKVQMLAEYLGVTTSELLGEELPGTYDLKAAFWGGEKDLTPEDLDAMWNDVKNFAAFVADKKRREKEEKK